MSFDLDAPAPALAEVDLAGVKAQVRTVSGMIDSRVRAVTAGMRSDVRAGAKAAERFGLDAGELGDEAALVGLPDFAHWATLASVIIVSWDVKRSGAPVPVTEPNVAALFNLYPEVLMAFRQHVASAAEERILAGELFAASPTITSGEAASSAADASSSTSPAVGGSPAASPDSSAPPSSTPPATPKRSRRGGRSPDTAASSFEPGSTGS